MAARNRNATQDTAAPETLRVGQINLARARLATDEARSYAAANQLDLLLIQEPYVVNGKVAGFGHSARVAQVATTTPWAAIVVISDGITATNLQHITTAQLAAVALTPHSSASTST